MSTRRFEKAALAGAAVSVAVLAYVLLNVTLLTAAHRLESSGAVYPYRDEDWLRYFLPAYFESDGRPRMMITGPSTARENLVLELFEAEFPDFDVFQGSLSLGTIEDVRLSLEYLEEAYGPEALPEVLVLGVAPRFLANIPEQRPFAPAVDNYSPYLGVSGYPQPLRLRPKSWWQGARSTARFLTQKQTSRYQTVLLYFARPLIPDALDEFVRQPGVLALVRKLPSVIEGPVTTILATGPGTFVERWVRPYKFRHLSPVEVGGLERWIDAPGGWWQEVFAWDPEAEAEAVEERLDALLDFVRRHEIPLFVVNLPERQMTQDRIRPRSYARYRELMTAGLQGTPMLDLRDELAENEYYDAEHATADGADRLTGIVLEFMREQGAGLETP